MRCGEMFSGEKVYDYRIAYVTMIFEIGGLLDEKEDICFYA